MWKRMCSYLTLTFIKNEPTSSTISRIKYLKSKIFTRSCKGLDSLQSPFMHITQTPGRERKDWVGQSLKDGSPVNVCVLNPLQYQTQVCNKCFLLSDVRGFWQLSVETHSHHVLAGSVAESAAINRSLYHHVFSLLSLLTLWMLIGCKSKLRNKRVCPL